MFSNQTYIIIIIVLLSGYHFYFHNKFEKMFSQTFLQYENVKRPLHSCHFLENANRFYCVGLPSGHAESIAVFCFLLYFYKFIPFWLCLLSIFAVSAQRVVSYKHTPFQVTIGALLGFLYASLYKRFDLSLYSMLIVVGIGITLVTSAALKKKFSMK